MYNLSTAAVFGLLAILILSNAQAYDTSTHTTLSLFQRGGGLNYGPCHYPDDRLLAMESSRNVIVSNGGVVANNRRGTGQNAASVSATAAFFDPADLHEYCPDAVVNNVSVECRRIWMEKTNNIPFILERSNSTVNIHCPVTMDAAMLIDHSVPSTSGENPHCGTLVAKTERTASFKAISSSAIDMFGQFHSMLSASLSSSPSLNIQAIWSKMTLYTTFEPSPDVMEQVMRLGIKEVVYSIPLGELKEWKYPITPIRALTMLRHQPTNRFPYTTAIIGQVDHESVSKYAAWQFNPEAPCPSMCQPFPSRGLLPSVRCRTN